MRKYILILILFICSLPIFAENASNVRVRQEGKNIVITYDLSKNSYVRVFVWTGYSYESKYVELKAISGDVGKGVKAGANRKIVWRPLDEYESFKAQNVRFKVEAQSLYDYYVQNAKIKTLLLGQVGYSVAPQLSYGLTVGQMYKGIGWYVNGRTNFQFGKPSQYTCDGQGYIEGERPFYSGKSSTIHYVINCGFMMNFLEWSSKNKFNTFGFYVGGGYGKRELQWETTDGLWVKYAPTSYAGFSGNIGLFGSIYGVTLNIGVNTINFKYMELEAGIGLVF